MNRNVNGELKELRIILQEIELKAINIIKGLHPFTLEGFTQKLFSKRSDNNNVYRYYENAIKDADEAGKNSGKEIIKCGLSSIKNLLIINSYLFTIQLLTG